MLKAAQNQKILLLPVMRAIKQKKAQRLLKMKKQRLRLIVVQITQKQIPKVEQILHLLLLQETLPHHRHQITITQLQIFQRNLNSIQQKMTVRNFALTSRFQCLNISAQRKPLLPQPQMVTAATLFGKPENQSIFLYQNR